jgi:hypothetical protein
MQRMLKHILLLFGLPLVTLQSTSAQGSFVAKGESAAGIGFGGALTGEMSSITGSVGATFWGKLDIGAALNVGGNIGKGKSISLSYYVLRATGGRFFASFDFVHTEVTLEKRTYVWPNNSFLVQESIEQSNQFGLSLGLAPGDSRRFSALPRFSMALVYPAGSDEHGGPVSVFGGSLSFLIPTIYEVQIVPTVEYANEEGVSIVGLGVHFL